MTDVAIIGAGMAGLVCAQQLTQAGYSVLVVEKSRGLGGRVATRRLYDTYADHGASSLKPSGELLGRFVELLCDRNILQLWTDTVYQFISNPVDYSPFPLPFGSPKRLPLGAGGGVLNNQQLSEPDIKPYSPCPTPHYVAPEGMSAIAKFLAQGLEILSNQRVIAITPTPENLWRLSLESGNEELTAKAVVVAIPAPQALMLLESLGEAVLGAAFLNNLRSVEFDPCLSVIAGYPPISQPLPDWKALTFIDDAVLRWIGLDSSKRPNPQQPVFVVQSSAAFAQHHDQTQDLQPLGQHMLNHAAESLLLPSLNTPDWMQVHRWRYAFPSHPWQYACLSAGTSLPLVCCGDWCGGNLVEDAMLSGLAAAEFVNNNLHHLHLPKGDFLDFFN